MLHLYVNCPSCLHCSCVFVQTQHMFMPIPYSQLKANLSFHHDKWNP